SSDLDAGRVAGDDCVAEGDPFALAAPADAGEIGQRLLAREAVGLVGVEPHVAAVAGAADGVQRGHSQQDHLAASGGQQAGGYRKRTFGQLGTVERYQQFMEHGILLQQPQLLPWRRHGPPGQSRLRSGSIVVVTVSSVLPAQLQRPGRHDPEGGAAFGTTFPAIGLWKALEGEPGLTAGTTGSGDFLDLFRHTVNPPRLRSAIFIMPEKWGGGNRGKSDQPYAYSFVIMLLEPVTSPGGGDWGWLEQPGTRSRERPHRSLPS